jgi:hypothetical protein
MPPILPTPRIASFFLASAFFMDLPALLTLKNKNAGYGQVFETGATG